MKLDNLVESAALRDLIVMDDETGVHIRFDFNDSTPILSLSRQLLASSSNRLIMSMIDDRLANLEIKSSGALTIYANASFPSTGWGEIVTPGYKRPSRLRRAARFIKDTLTRIVGCGIMLLYIDW